MDSNWFAHFLQQDSGVLVFINVLLQQLGLPVPSVPTMMLAASQASGMTALSGMLLAAVLASLLADWIWYQAGRMFGYRVLSLLCKLSINPSSCVSQTEARFTKWGVWSLVFGKFIPGFSTVAPPVAGALGMPRSSFFIASALGAALWAGLALLAGYAFQAQIDGALVLLSLHGVRLALVLLVLIALWLGWKFWQKYRFERLAAMHHISPEEMLLALASARPPHILDLRSKNLVAESGRIPNAHVTDYEAITQSLAHVPKDYPIVTICACPQDAGAVQVARSLQALGYTNAHPLRGGFDAWKAMAGNDPGLLILASG
ncbi:MAG: VTT domain-containing protein [Undibacterium sp.]|uniref:VTT domain-containing protein n=1 Tax=Undibacterium sp. TaxID=1914977 RepID=UPI0027167B47|nr:VTT domain-containing protein [Undibacterium sp.]MDO8652233.1 VTT domain-containing protein [Undibacterium sp.]